MAYPEDDNNCWSTETYNLAEIPDKVELPTLVRVTEGIYTTQDCSTFSQGDIIRIDGCETIEMVSAHLALLNNGCFKPQGKELYVPLNYKGRVRVCSVHGSYNQYTSVEELIRYFPKFVKIHQSISFTDNKGTTIRIQANDVIELLKKIISHKTGAKSLRVRQNNCEIILPSGLKCLFVDVDFTIGDLMKYKMPQCIKFLGQDINLFTSKDIQEAAANIDHYDGYLMLSGKRKNRVVLVGHYKALESEPSSTFCRRSAVVLPMDNPDISSIQVQIPIYMDFDDYQVFVLKHFSESDVSLSVEGLLYIEFSKNPTVTFLNNRNTSPPIVPPRSDCSTEQLNPQMPLHPLNSAEHPRHQNEPTRTDLFKQPQPTPFRPTHVVAPIQRGTGAVQADAMVGAAATGTAGHGDSASTSALIGDIFSDTSVCTDNTVRKELGNSDSPVSHEKRLKRKSFLYRLKKKIFGKSHSNGKKEKTRSDDGYERTESEPVYDYVDEYSSVSVHAKELMDTSKSKSGTKNTEEDMKAKTSVVQTFQQVDEQMHEKQFKNLTVDELQACFQRCALKGLAQIVSSQKLDGSMFSILSNADLKKKPICLNNLEIRKVRQIQKGWRPNVQ